MRPSAAFRCWNAGIKYSENFLYSFDDIRRDRVDYAHGGVFIDFRRDLVCTATPDLDPESEIIWCKLNTIGCRTLYLDSFYRPPDRTEKEYLEAFNVSLTRIIPDSMTTFGQRSFFWLFAP